MSSPSTVTLTVAAILVCAVQAMRARRLLVSAMWLAGASAATSLLLYALGAAEVAVIELSVGAGLVTVLFVFAINIAGDEPIGTTSRVPRPLAWTVTLGSFALLAWLTLPIAGVPLPVPGAERFAVALWEHRSADVLLQVAIIFAGVLGVIGLLSEEPAESARPGVPALAQETSFETREHAPLAQGRPFDAPADVALAQGKETV